MEDMLKAQSNYKKIVASTSNRCRKEGEFGENLKLKVMIIPSRTQKWDGVETMYLLPYMGSDIVRTHAKALRA